ncbi:class I mannose-6-phosphate isomerase [Lentisphaerota bacterium ZTH]|nr:class I mannose-6-phosphate isomerase [Lentisphaerota bacterium]WET06016.1 class I mannose-6-phosphate isomerase [Lentisphaerota bacterium ZTH]
MEMIDRDNLYPIVFEPVYHDKMWGGTQISDVLKRTVPAMHDPVGESWEIVDRDDEQSVVSNGPLKGATISQLVNHYGKSLLGSKFNGGRFPLLVKLIDAGKRLSLQVHPDEQACARIGDGTEPKTEMWYIISARKGAKIMAGMNPRSTKQQLLSTLNSSEVEDHLQVYPSQPGDAYFISSGTLHAIGEGNLLLEIQQNSDTTYRVSDWGRVDSSGHPRELHVDKAMDSINFTNRTSPRIPGVVGEVTHNRKFPVVNRCRFFAVDDLRLAGEWVDNTVASSSFHLISAINKPVRVGNKERYVELAAGQTCLVPANFGTYKVIPLAEGECDVLKSTL